MDIEKKVNGEDFVVAISGRLDTATAPKLEESLLADITKMRTLTLDCEKLEYISSAGLRVLLSMQ